MFHAGAPLYSIVCHIYIHTHSIYTILRVFLVVLLASGTEEVGRGS